MGGCEHSYWQHALTPQYACMEAVRPAIGSLWLVCEQEGWTALMTASHRGRKDQHHALNTFPVSVLEAK